jgi:hypothetical protein
MFSFTDNELIQNFNKYFIKLNQYIFEYDDEIPDYYFDLIIDFILDIDKVRSNKYQTITRYDFEKNFKRYIYTSNEILTQQNMPLLINIFRTIDTPETYFNPINIIVPNVVIHHDDVLEKIEINTLNIKKKSILFDDVIKMLKSIVYNYDLENFYDSIIIIDYNNNIIDGKWKFIKYCILNNNNKIHVYKINKIIYTGMDCIRLIEFDAENNIKEINEEVINDEVIEKTQNIFKKLNIDNVEIENVKIENVKIENKPLKLEINSGVLNNKNTINSNNQNILDNVLQNINNFNMFQINYKKYIDNWQIDKTESNRNESNRNESNRNESNRNESNRSNIHDFRNKFINNITDNLKLHGFL